jgi:beta-glucanase (GH16 family)
MRFGVVERLIAVSLAATAATLLSAGLGARAEAAVSQTACGTAQIQKSTGGYWQCSFVDNFAGSALNRNKWLPQRTDKSGFWDGTSCFVDGPDNVSVSDGTLKLTSRREAQGFTCPHPHVLFGSFQTQYTSGMVSTWARFSQTYGRFEVRTRISPTRIPGLQTSLWLWPVDAMRYGHWPASGEIDIAEMFSAYPDRAVPYIHYNASGTDPNVTSHDCTVSNLGAFHRYAAEWTPGAIKILYDGRTCLVDKYNPASPLSRPQPFDHPFIIALTQGLGQGNNAFNHWSPPPLPATTEVDYVRVWR